MIWTQLYCRVDILPIDLFSTENNGKHQKFVFLATIVTRVVLFIRGQNQNQAVFDGVS